MGRRFSRGLAAALGPALAGGLALAAGPAEAGCTGRIVNKSAHTARVSRDGGPWVTIPPKRSQAIRYVRPGRLEVAVHCGRLGRGALADPPAHTASYAYQAVIDRCYLDIDGGGTQPLTLNNPRPGDIVVGPRVEECAPRL